MTLTQLGRDSSGSLSRTVDQPALRRVGVEVGFSRDMASRSITISTGAGNSVMSVMERHAEASTEAAMTLDDADDALSQGPANGARLSDEQITSIGTMRLDELQDLEERPR